MFIAGNIPYETQITPLIIMGKLEQFNYGDATAIALVMLMFSFAILLVLNAVQQHYNKVTGRKT